MDRERHVEVAHVLIGLIGSGGNLQEFGYILSFTVQLRNAGLHLPLIALAQAVCCDAGDLNEINFGKVIRMHAKSVAHAA